MTPPTIVLAIETSCDETGVAIVAKEGERVSTVAQALASQTAMHAATGGVIPEQAAREHVRTITPLIEHVLAASPVQDISGIAVTTGPGLQPALSVGVAAARTLAYVWQKPLVPVHHLEGHIYSALLEGPIVFPALALIVSGGHTQLVLVQNHGSYEVVGSTRDDAAGEAFDKVARLLGLSYPGGPAISAAALNGNPEAYAFSRPMVRSGDLDFSFSGLKTEVLYTWRKLAAAEQTAQVADIAASFQQAVIDTLVSKTKDALQRYQPAILLVAGGVSANRLLRTTLEALASRQGVEIRQAPQVLTGDNAVMIGQAGVFALERGRRSDWRTVDASARLNLAQEQAWG